MTTFDEVIDLALSSITDWRLTKIYKTDVNSFNKVMDSMLLKSIPKFVNCAKNLYDYDRTLRQFNDTLDLDEQTILANLIVLEWMETQINDTRTASLLLNDTDFKHGSEANMLKQKIETRNQLREMVDRNLCNYSLKHIDWKKMINGDYYT